MLYNLPMQILGKFIGAILGYLLAGPIGLVVGVVFGHFFDSGYVQKLLTPQRAIIEAIFFRATFTFMGYIAKADGHISPAEIQTAQKIMQNLNLSATQQQQAIAFFNTGKQNTFDSAALINELKIKLHPYPNLLTLFMEIQIQIAYADNNISAREKNILLQLCQQLGFNPADFNLLRNTQTEKPTASLTAYEILQISPQASDAEVKQAYRRLMHKYHPDKLIAKGLPEELLSFATQKTQQIRIAYEEICKSRR